VLGGLAGGLILGEAALRLIGFRFANFYQPDEHVGFTLRPGAEGWWLTEGTTYIRINSDGWRDREHAKEKPAGTVRIAVLGDSFVEALQVPMEATFWAVMERRLQECAAFGGATAEVLGFGVSGFSTVRELITLRRRVWAYAPDIVVLVVTTQNDIRDNSPLLNPEPADVPLPYFVYQNGALRLDDSRLRRRSDIRFRLQQSGLDAPVSWLRDHVRLLGLIHWAATTVRNRALRERRGVAGTEPGLDARVYLEPTDTAWAEAWRVTEGLVLLVRDEVRAHGAELLLVTASQGIQVHFDPAVRQAFMRKIGTADLSYPDRRLRALGEREGIDVLNLAPALAEYAERHRVFLHGRDGSGHWNAAGHALVGERLAEKLCARRPPGDGILSPRRDRSTARAVDERSFHPGERPA
jgi:hypothetical protein